MQRRDIATAEMAYSTPTYIMIHGSGPISMNMIASGLEILSRHAIAFGSTIEVRAKGMLH